MSGKDKSRPLWSRYYSDTIALVWVVDSSDATRLQLCRQELHQLLREPELRQAIILVYLNKQDLRNGETSTVCESVSISFYAKGFVCQQTLERPGRLWYFNKLNIQSDIYVLLWYQARST